MLVWLIAVLAGVIAATLQYGRSALAPRTAPLALLRAVVGTLVVALLFDAPAARGRAIAPDIALDASESWLRGTTHCDRWRMALDSAAYLGGSRWMRFGDSLRVDPSVDAPVDHASHLRPVADRAAATGRPVVVITDGELEDADAVAALPRGSRFIVIPCTPAPDVSVATLDVPRTLLVGDTLTARITLVAGPVGGPAGRLDLRLDGSVIATANYAEMGRYGEQMLAVRGVATGAERAGVLQVVIHGDGDLEPRNDTLAVGVDVSRAPATVFVSTAPDYDAREAVAALRGVTSLPTRAYYRVAPGTWRSDGTLAPVDESVVRAAVREAPLVVLHGDTSAFGPPRSAARGALLLFAPPPSTVDDGEWFAAATPSSPLAPALSTLPFDSLPPLSVAPNVPRGEWQGLVARRGGAPDDRRVVLSGSEVPRHIAVLGASGLWRWRFRGGARADAYDALFGSLFDWLAAGRADRRVVVPEAEPLRAGMPVRWRRGAPGDSVVSVTVTRRSATSRVYSLTLRFADGASVVESPALPTGIYDARMPGGSAVLVVNASRELVPRRPTVGATKALGFIAFASGTGVREMGWVWLLAILLLCTEWLLRRRVGLR